jgi:hypothetical protein
MMPTTGAQRVEMVRRSIAGYTGMLATAVATAEALGRLGDDEAVKSFEAFADALRLVLKFASKELDRLERTS